MEDYRYPMFELWNVFSRGMIIMASTIMYPTKRWYTHITIMSVSFVITAGSRPYVDFESNMVAILFCIIDILGAISAWQSSGGNEPSPGFQILFVVALLLALIVVLVLALKATNERIRISNNEMSHGSVKRSVWKTYTKCELIFLFPVLVVVFVVSFIFKGLCRRSQKKKKKQNKLTAVLPKTISKSQIEEKTAVLDKLRMKIERQQSSSENEEYWDI